MNTHMVPVNRRLFLGAAALGGLSYFTPGVFAEELTKTPKQTDGPFYPNKLPLDTDNDLIIINEDLTPSVGTIAHLTGKVLDAKGNPVRNALVEIWQCDANGVYLHTKDSEPKKDKQDKHFQGFGRFLTCSTGEYYFRTIKPVPYPGRTPHIHVKIKQGKNELLCTQCFNKTDKARNEKDGIYMGIRDPKARESVTLDFAAVKDSKIGELQANFTIVLGTTPSE